MSASTSSLRVYIAAPYADAAAVRAVHAELRRDGISAVSAWADFADGPEKLEALSLEGTRAIARANDQALLSAHLVVALPRDGAGGEMFAEVRIALEYGIPVIWAGRRRPLSAYRPGVLRVGDARAALEHVGLMTGVIRRPWPVEDDWVRDTLWDLFLERDEAAEEDSHAA